MNCSMNDLLLIISTFNFDEIEVMVVDFSCEFSLPQIDDFTSHQRRPVRSQILCLSSSLIELSQTSNLVVFLQIDIDFLTC